MIALPARLEKSLENLSFEELMHLNEITSQRLVAAFHRRGIDFPAWMLDVQQPLTETPPDAMSITLTIPRAALAVLTSKTPAAAYQELIDSGRLPLVELLTFAAVNTPISDTPTWNHERVIAYVSNWDGNFTTLCALDGDTVRLVYGCQFGITDPAESLAFFRRHWPSV